MSDVKKVLRISSLKYCSLIHDITSRSCEDVEVAAWKNLPNDSIQDKTGRGGVATKVMLITLTQRQ